MSTLSGKEIGQEYLSRVEAYLAQTDSLPVSREGTLNITAIAEQAGVPKQSLYKNPAIKQAIQQAKAKQGLHSWAEQRATATEGGQPQGSASQPTKGTAEGKRLQAAERRLSVIEQQNAALTAENFELRRQLKEARQQLGREDMVIDTGRRIPPPRSNNA